MASHLGDEDTVPDTPRPPAEDMADQQQQQGSGGTTGGYVTAVLSGT